MNTDYFYLLKNGIKSGPYPYHYIKDSLADQSLPADQPVLYNDEWVEASSLIKLIEGESQERPTAIEVSTQTKEHTGPPLPTIARNPRPTTSIPPVQTPQAAEEAPQQNNKVIDEEEYFEGHKDLYEEGKTDLYQRARFFFLAGYATGIPIIGLAIAFLCWRKTRIWNTSVDENQPTLTVQMVLLASRASFAWFLFAAASTFLCLTSSPLPSSILELGIVQIAVVVISILLTGIIYGLNKVLLDDELNLEGCALIGIRATTGVFVYFLVVTTSSMGSLVGFVGAQAAWLITYCITAYAIMAQMNIFHSRVSYLRLLIIAALAWLMLYYLLKYTVALLT